MQNILLEYLFIQVFQNLLLNIQTERSFRIPNSKIPITQTHNMFTLSASTKCFTSFFYLLEKCILASTTPLFPVLQNTNARYMLGSIKATKWLGKCFKTFVGTISNLCLSPENQMFGVCVCVCGGCWTVEERG